MQKNMVILFILALIFSSFGSIPVQVYANEEDIVEPSEQIREDPKIIKDDSADSVDKNALEAKFIEIDSAGLDEAGYTEASLEALQDALTEADTILSDDDATQDEVDETLGALTKAYNRLKGADDK